MIKRTILLTKFYCRLNNNLNKILNPSVLFLNNENNYKNYSDIYKNLYFIYNNIKIEGELYIGNHLMNSEYKIIFDKLEPNFNKIIFNLKDEIKQIETDFKKDKKINVDQIYNLLKIIKGIYYYEKYWINSDLYENYNKLILFFNKIFIIKNNNSQIINNIIILILEIFNRINFMKNNNLENFKDFNEKPVFDLIFLLKINKIKNLNLNELIKIINFRQDKKFDLIITNSLKEIINENLKFKNNNLTSNILELLNLYKNITYFKNIENNLEKLIILNKYINNVFKKIVSLLNKKNYYEFEDIYELFNVYYNNNRRSIEIENLKNIYNFHLDLFIKNKKIQAKEKYINFLKFGLKSNFINSYNLNEINNEYIIIINNILKSNELIENNFSIFIFYIELNSKNSSNLKKNKNIIFNVLNLFMKKDNFMLNNWMKILENLEKLALHENKEFLPLLKKFAVFLNTNIIKQKKLSIENLTNVFKFCSMYLYKIEEDLILTVFKKVKFFENDLIKFIEILKYLFVFQRITRKITYDLDRKYINKNKKLFEIINSFSFQIIIDELSASEDKKIYIENILKLFLDLFMFIKTNVDNLGYAKKNENIINILTDKMYFFFKDLIENEKLFYKYNAMDNNNELLLELIIILKRIKKTEYIENHKEAFICSFLVKNILNKKSLDDNFYKLFSVFMNFNITKEDYSKVCYKILNLLEEQKIDDKNIKSIIGQIYNYTLKDKNIYKTLDNYLLNKNWFSDIYTLYNLNLFQIILLNVVYRNKLELSKKLILNLIDILKINKIKISNTKLFNNLNIFIKQFIYFIKNNGFETIAKSKEFILLENNFIEFVEYYKIDFDIIKKNKFFYSSIFQNEIQDKLNTLGYKFKNEEFIEGFLIDVVLENGKIIEAIGSRQFLGNTNIISSLLTFKIDFLRLKKYDVIELYSKEFYDFYNKEDYILRKILG